MPVHSATITFATKWVDEALGFAMGWNFFLNIVLNVISVTWFGAAEFYIGMFKVLLALALIFYTFITMVGGNPQHDTYGFRYWNDPGAFAENLVGGASGRICGVVAAVVRAGFTICGPEYLSMIAAETKQPRKVIRRAYKTFLVRVLLFFVGGALCIGIVIPYDDPTLARLLGEGVSTGAASPYVISMQRLGIAGLGSVVNAGIMLSLLSAGNALLFSATRTLHGMAVEGKAPRFFAYCTKKGVPIRALIASLSVCLLGLLQVSESSAKVMDYLVVLITANQLLNHFSVSLTYIHFYRALKAQGIDRNTLPYKGRFQPYTSYIAVASTAILALLLGFDVFVDLPNNWDLTYLFLDYAMIVFFIVLFVGWKVVKKTNYLRPTEVDLGLGKAKSEIDEHERMSDGAPPLLLATCSTILYIAINAYINLIHSPLSSIPGPELFALTKWRLALEDYRGTRTRSMQTLHEKYGAVVRIGPNEVSFNSLSALRTLYDRKKMLNHAYSKSVMLSPRNASMVEGKVKKFMDLISNEADSKGNLEIFSTLHYFSLDSISQFLYGKNQPGATAALSAPGAPDRDLIGDIIDPARRKLSWFAIHLPRLTGWLYSRSSFVESILSSLHLLPMQRPTTYTGIRAYALKAAEQINGLATPDANESIAERLFLASRKENLKTETPLEFLDIASECADHLLAGIDTTSDTLMWAIFCLSQPENKVYQEKLRDEIRSLDLGRNEEVVNAPLADTLPYLDAIIKETLRLFAPLPGTAPRVAETDQVVDGYTIPAGTTVSISPYTLHRNADVFEEPERFNPERWLKKDPATGKEDPSVSEMKRWFWAFSSGGRMCIGMQ
ncbi:amino acid permease-domain-containing protein [Aspergillus filifer]